MDDKTKETGESVRALLQQRGVQVVAGVVGTLVLGALGSGLWERIVGPALDKLSLWSVAALASVFTGYLDSVYRAVARAPEAEYAKQLFAMSVAVIIPAPWVLSLSYRKMRNSTKDVMRRIERLRRQSREPVEGVAFPSVEPRVETEERSRTEAKDAEEQLRELEVGAQDIENQAVREGRRLGMIGVVFTIFWISALFRANYSMNAKVFVERSIEMLGPKITEQKRLELRAKFRAVESSNDFHALVEELRALAANAESTLPTFTLL